MTTWEELANEVNDYLSEGPEPSIEDGWFTADQAMALEVFAGLSPDGVRFRLRRMSYSGKLEYKRWNRRNFYRLPKRE